MRKLAPLLLLVASVAWLPARAVTTCPAPRCIETTVPTTVTVPDNHIRVILPASYDQTAQRYPVLYLLHGAGDTYKAWTDHTDILALTESLDLIVVMPDSGHDAEAGWYSDWKDGSRQWETFHIRDMLAFVDSNFRTLGDGHRAIAGLSMGGYGAMADAARHPGMFGAAAAFSGAVDIDYAFPVTGVAFKALHDRFGTPDDRIWGNQITDHQTWVEHNPTEQIEGLRATKLFLATGNGVPGGAYEDPSNIGGYGTEHGVWQMNLSFVRALDAAEIAHVDRFYGAGQHSWPYWRDDLAWLLPQLMPAIA